MGDPGGIGPEIVVKALHELGHGYAARAAGTAFVRFDLRRDEALDVPHPVAADDQRPEEPEDHGEEAPHDQGEHPAGELCSFTALRHGRGA